MATISDVFATNKHGGLHKVALVPRYRLSLAATSPSFVFANVVALFNALLCLFLSDPASAGGVGS